MQYAIFIIQHPAFQKQYAIFYGQSYLLNTQYAIHSLQYVMVIIKYWICNKKYTVRNMQHATCNIKLEIGNMGNEICNKLYAIFNTNGPIWFTKICKTFVIKNVFVRGMVSYGTIDHLRLNLRICMSRPIGQQPRQLRLHSGIYIIIMIILIVIIQGAHHCVITILIHEPECFAPQPRKR